VLAISVNEIRINRVDMSRLSVFLNAKKVVVFEGAPEGPAQINGRGAPRRSVIIDQSRLRQSEVV